MNNTEAKLNKIFNNAYVLGENKGRFLMYSELANIYNNSDTPENYHKAMGKYITNTLTEIDKNLDKFLGDSNEKN